MHFLHSGFGRWYSLHTHCFLARCLAMTSSTSSDVRPAALVLYFLDTSDLTKLETLQLLADEFVDAISLFTSDITSFSSAISKIKANFIRLSFLEYLNYLKKPKKMPLMHIWQQKLIAHRLFGRPM